MLSRKANELICLDPELERVSCSSDGKSSPARGQSSCSSPDYVLKESMRIKTRSLSLSSGFEYNKVLFDLHIDPTRWDEFSSDVAKASRLNRNDKAAIIATIAGFSMLGLAGVGIVLGERVHSAKKMRRVMANREEGGILAEVLHSWNENYFSQFGVSVWVEVSEVALRNQAKKAGMPAAYSEHADGISTKLSFSKQARKKAEEARKYMVVVSPLARNAESESTSRDSSAIPNHSFGLVMDSHVEDLIDLTDDWSYQPDAHEPEDPFADPPEYLRTVYHSKFTNVEELA
ncbi:uncharacterized protein PV09_05568 [Verruconis gallopava]|uniref:Uncharacterized protein n=1 Tax=Verruconis gallopava TaxID=253628 RepID=A0A0D2A9S3_9PEZI|nr:uncharacterized protein PV09_05568 [Verruconis gallopava]KIW03360.1 hypothetical protein PV09_05568 [Verruconis gallopava]